MENWLVKARIVSNLSVEECAMIIGCERDEMLLLESCPGELTLNDVGVLLRRLPEVGASVVAQALVEMADGARRSEGSVEERMD